MITRGITPKLLWRKWSCSRLNEVGLVSRRSYSSGGGDGGGGTRWVLLGSSAVVAGIGGTIAGAAFSPDFRKTIEDTVPGGQMVLNACLGQATPAIDLSVVDPPKIKEKVKKVAVTKKEEKEKLPDLLQPIVAPAVVEAPPIVPPPPIETPVAKKKEEEKGANILATAQTAVKETSGKVKEVAKELKTEAKKDAVSTQTSSTSMLTLDPPLEQAVAITQELSTNKEEEEAVAFPATVEKTIPSTTTTLSEDEVSNLRQEMEGEMIAQLQRQTAAYQQHLKQELRQQREQLTKQYDSILQDKLSEASVNYHLEMAKMMAELKGLHAGLEGYLSMDRSLRQASSLWFATASLQNTLKAGPDTKGGNAASDWSGRSRSIKTNVEEIKRIAAETGSSSVASFVHAALSSLPTVALERGVLSQNDIKDRFMDVDRLGRRVALIGDDGGSLFKYFLSYLMSSFMFSSPPSPAVLRAEVIEPEQMNTIDILDRAKYCLDKDDLTQAVRYVQLLRGESRRLASDWLEEAVVLLETKMVADALMAFAASAPRLSTRRNQ